MFYQMGDTTYSGMLFLVNSNHIKFSIVSNEIHKIDIFYPCIGFVTYESIVVYVDFFIIYSIKCQKGNIVHSITSTHFRRISFDLVYSNPILTISMVIFNCL